MGSGVSGLGSGVQDGDGGVRVILMGLRGSGKTTLGRLVAERIGGRFVDLDDRTTAILGHDSLREAWESVGEVGFREGEVRALREQLGACDGPARVLALGGGTPTAPGAPDLLRDLTRNGSAVLVYLRGSPATLRDRLRSAKNIDRPSLTGIGVLEEIEQVFNARDQLYRDLATEVIDIDEPGVEELVDVLARIADSKRS